MRIDQFGAPLMVAWQFTKDCDLACMHCCADSSPGGRLPNELSRAEALHVASQIVQAEVPYVAFGGGEAALSGHFFDVAEALGRGGVQLKVETNGQRIRDRDLVRLAALPIRSVQVSLDAVTQTAYAKLRPTGSLEAALRTARKVRELGMPLELTFAPTNFNIAEADAVLDRAVELGAFRFNTGRLMCLGRAARLWEALEPASQEYGRFLRLLEHRAQELAGSMQLCYQPFSLREGVNEFLSEPPGTLIVAPDGKVKVSGLLPFICADLRQDSLAQAWDAYRAACRSDDVQNALKVLLYEDLPVVV
ncbi:MAG: radical SAM protein [Elusimicrobiota bacterium]|jgi:MoaA/NifB/PqqE/SkfB family radical SAM enzyme